MAYSQTNLNRTVPPFLKWAGGKRWFVENHADLLSTDYNRFIEPFLGSGAVYFKLQPSKALLSDCNKDLINTYTVIRDNWAPLTKLLGEHQKNHSKDYYYRVRAESYSCLVKRAARFIYLNRTCWNGLYRVNLKGQFNVPIGTKQKVVLDTDNFESMSNLLKGASFQSCDFQETLEQANCNDLVFIDPPYTVKHNLNGFVKYNEGLFSWNDQVRLRDNVVSAISRGAKILVTNAHHESIKELYCNVGEQITLTRRSVISGKPSSRGRYDEMLIKCF